jgi:hypothetical protein
MPVIQFDDNDYLAAQSAEAGWHPSILTKIESRPSTSGKGTNTFLEFTLSGGKLKGKVLPMAVSSANRAGSASLLGGTMWYSKDIFVQIAAAITKCKPADVPKTLDTDTLLQQPLDIKLGVDTAEGNIKNPVIGFAPSGMGALMSSEAAPF